MMDTFASEGGHKMGNTNADEVLRTYIGNYVGKHPGKEVLTAIDTLRAVSNGEGLVLTGNGTATRVFAEVVALERLKAWQNSEKVTPASGNICLARLFMRQCPHGYYNPTTKGVPHRPPLADHASLWKRDGITAIYVSQPYSYNLSMAALAELTTFCEQHGLHWYLSAALSWHFPGETVLIAIKRLEEPITDR